MPRALQSKMSDKCGYHKNGDTHSAKADEFQAVIEQHDGKGKFQYSHQVTQPLGQVEGFKLVFNIFVAHDPHKDDGSKYENAEDLQNVWQIKVHGLQALINCPSRKSQKSEGIRKSERCKGGR